MIRELAHASVLTFETMMKLKQKTMAWQRLFDPFIMAMSLVSIKLKVPFKYD